MKIIGMAVALSLLGTTAFASGPSFGDTPAIRAGQADFAANDRTGLGVNLGVSTLGTTVEPVWRINRNVGFRLPIGAADYAFDSDLEGDRYEGNVNLDGYGLVADYYPRGGGFHFSAGAFKTDYSADLTRFDYDMGGGATTDINVKISQKKEVSPFLGMGYEGRIGRHITTSLDAGALLTDGFNVDASESSGTFTQGQIDAETADLREAAADVRAVPYIKVAIGVRF